MRGRAENGLLDSMRALFLLILASCSIEPILCPGLDAEHFSKARVVERSCPPEEFEPNYQHRCSLEATEFDEKACTVSMLYYCTGVIVVESRSVGEDGLTILRKEYQEIASGCRVVLERVERRV